MLLDEGNSSLESRVWRRSARDFMQSGGVVLHDLGLTCSSKTASGLAEFGGTPV